MLTYLDKFNNLDPELRDRVSTEPVLAAMEEIENKYGVSLASVVMRVMVKEISIVDLAKYFVFENGLDGRDADQLAEELKEKVFLGAADYLGFVVDESKVVANEDQYSQWTQNKRNEADVRGSNFFFSSEDEEEVRELAKKVEVAVPSQTEIQKEDDKISRKIDQICKQLKVSFSSEELNKRFQKVLNTYLKGVRNTVDTKQTLIKAIDAGGLSMDPIYVDNILLVADKINADFIDTPSQPKKDDDQKAIYNNLQQNGVRDVDYDFGSLTKKAEPKEKITVPPPSAPASALRFTNEADISEENEKKNESSGDEVIDLTNFDQKNDTANGDFNLPAESGDDIISKAEEGSVAAPINIASARRIAIDEDKAKMEDVKYRPKLTGPVDELRELDLLNFRRLNSDPEVVVDKIKQKIKNLEAESYTKRLAGIKSWRQSPINRLYLEIGQESLLKKKTVPEIIEARATNGQEYLTKEEFEVIVNLNKDLKY